MILKSLPGRDPGRTRLLRKDHAPTRAPALHPASRRTFKRNRSPFLTSPCTVIVDGRRINSCLALAVSHDGAQVLTIEGVARGKNLHPVQEAFLAQDGLQCGFCTPGQIMSAIGLIEEDQVGDDPERVREGMSGNLCRCGAYKGITEAVLDAQRTLAAQSRKEVA